MAAADVPTRYACAHVAALRAAAALLAARARPRSSRRRRRPQKNAWVLLAEVAPELTEWATFFAAGAAKRAAAEAGSTRAVTEREADDLVRDADRFLAVVEQALGLAPHVAVAVQLCVLRPRPPAPRGRLDRMDPFVHLHVASGYSLQYGASHPHVARRAGRRAGDGHPRPHRPRRHLRRGQARAGLPGGRAPAGAGRRPGGDPAGRGGAARGGRQRPRTPVRGGAFRDDRLVPRVTFLADAEPAGGRAGWAAICRLVSAIQLAGERGAGGRPGAARALARER